MFAFPLLYSHPRIFKCMSGWLVLAAILLFSTHQADAQGDLPGEPYYTVQPGDSLWDIAWRFGVSVEDLQAANDINDPSHLNLEARLVIPGLEGIQGRVGTTTLPIGENLRSMSRRYGINQNQLAQINRVVNPSTLYPGGTLIVPADQSELGGYGRKQLKPGQSLLELGLSSGVNPWNLAAANALPGPASALPGDVLLLPGGVGYKDGPGALPETVMGIKLDPLRPMQGKTTIIQVYAPPGLNLIGSLAGIGLNFFPYEEGYLALQGIPAMLEHGLYPLTLTGYNQEGEEFFYNQTILVRSGNYLYDPPLVVDPATLEDEVVLQEDELWLSLALPVSPEKMWEGQLGVPVPLQLKDCWTSLFGSRRSYNGSEYRFYHAGLDFCGREGTELYAPAPGRVVYTGSLAIRGDVIVLDHGWGVYTAYAHLSETMVTPDEIVHTGQVIGKGGSTGRSTGPHLHWEVWVGGYPVDPVEWLENVIPPLEYSE
jgi:murein DD-endopeptidase MepM/ murein hydrolase activator NlpD